MQTQSFISYVLSLQSSSQIEGITFSKILKEREWSGHIPIRHWKRTSAIEHTETHHQNFWLWIVLCWTSQDGCKHNYICQSCSAWVSRIVSYLFILCSFLDGNVPLHACVTQGNQLSRRVGIVQSNRIENSYILNDMMRLNHVNMISWWNHCLIVWMTLNWDLTMLIEMKINKVSYFKLKSSV